MLDDPAIPEGNNFRQTHPGLIGMIQLMILGNNLGLFRKMGPAMLDCLEPEKIVDELLTFEDTPDNEEDRTPRNCRFSMSFKEQQLSVV